MTCVDLSNEFVAEARNLADESGVNLKCLTMDMRDIDFKETFDGAFCFGNSFGYMDRDSNLDFLTRIARSLKPGANFMMETGVIAESLLPSLPARRWHRVNDIIVISENRYDASESELHTEYTFIRGGVMESGTATYRVYTVAELKALLASCGLVVTAMYGSRDRTPFHLGDRLFLTVRKMGK
jgi:SAM-dependent methyltransferase